MAQLVGSDDRGEIWTLAPGETHAVYGTVMHNASTEWGTYIFPMPQVYRPNSFVRMHEREQRTPVINRIKKLRHWKYRSPCVHCHCPADTCDRVIKSSTDDLPCCIRCDHKEVRTP
jgi:hypothetical protein